MQCVVEPLGANLGHLPTVARWHWDEWGGGYPDSSLEEWIEQLSLKTVVDGLPSTWIALIGDQPVGSVTIELDGVEPRPELQPDVAGLFVLPSYRLRGIGSALMSACEEGARKAGIQQLYLHTEAAEQFYTRRGWTTMEQTTFLEQRAAIMSKRL